MIPIGEKVTKNYCYQKTFHRKHLDNAYGVGFIS